MRRRTSQRPMAAGARTVQASGMHCFTLITRPGRAAALVATVGLLFAAQSTLALGDAGVGAATHCSSRSSPRRWRDRRVRAAPQPLRRDRGRDRPEPASRSRSSRSPARSRPAGRSGCRCSSPPSASRRSAWRRSCGHDATRATSPAGCSTLTLAGTCSGSCSPRRRLPRAGRPLARRRRGALERLRGARLQPGSVDRLSTGPRGARSARRARRRTARRRRPS